MSVFYKKCKVEQVGSRPRSCNNIFLFISSPGNLIACYPHIAIFVEAPHLLRKICTLCIIKHSSYVRTIVISWLHIFPKEQKMRQPLAHNFPDFTLLCSATFTIFFCREALSHFNFHFNSKWSPPLLLEFYLDRRSGIQTLNYRLTTCLPFFARSSNSVKYVGGEVHIIVQ